MKEQTRFKAKDRLNKCVIETWQSMYGLPYLQVTLKSVQVPVQRFNLTIEKARLLKKVLKKIPNL